MWKLDTTKMSRTSDKMSTYNTKGDGSRATIDMWYRRA